MAPLFRSSSGREVRNLGALSAVGLALVVAVVMGAAAGYGIDRWLGTSPWGFLAGFVIGVVAGIRTLLRTVAAVSGKPPER